MDSSDSEWDSVSEKQGTSPKKGRRAAATVVAADHNAFDNATPDQDENSTVDGAPPKPPRRRTGGWAETTAKSAKGFAQNEAENDEDNQTDATAIPDLDDFEEDNVAAQIAKAPHVAINRVATYRELDSDLSKHAAFLTLDDIDLKSLTKFLSPEYEIREADVPWTWDNLMADVSSTLNRDAESDAEK